MRLRTAGSVATLAVLVVACTAIRPLDPYEASVGRDGSAMDAGADAGTRADADVDAGMDGGDAALDAARPDTGVDTGPPDAGCGDAIRLYYVDVDGDGYGDDATQTASCVPLDGGGWVTRGGDCDDTRPTRHPRATENCNGLDDDCDGTVDNGVSTCGGGFPLACPVRTMGTHAYAFCSAPQSQAMAEINCESFGYHLVVIDDAAENDFVHTELRSGGMFGSFGWIGLTVPTRTMPMWIDGTPVGYVDWESGEPNGSGMCVRMRGTTGAWNDADCSFTSSYVCEAP